MDLHNTDDAVTRRIKAMNDRVAMLKEHDLYFYNQPVEELLNDSKVRVRGREMGMYASYGYLGLLNHPRINAADTAHTTTAPPPPTPAPTGTTGPAGASPPKDASADAASPDATSADASDPDAACGDAGVTTFRPGDTCAPFGEGTPAAAVACRSTATCAPAAARRTSSGAAR